MKLQPINLSIPDSVRKAFNGTADVMKMALNKKGDSAEILVMGVIGDSFEGLSAEQMVKSIRDLSGIPINVRINSPGGLAFDGITIFNALLQHDAPVTTTIEGIAGSAASIIAMSGSTVRMFANASLFIHRAMTISIGNAAVMRDTADFLDVLDDGIVRTYAAKTRMAQDKIRELLTGKVDGTTMTAKEAADYRFVDEIVDLKPKNSTDDHIPDDSGEEIRVNLMRRMINIRLSECDLPIRQTQERPYGVGRGPDDV